MKVEPRVPADVLRFARCEADGCTVKGRCAHWALTPHSRGPWLHSTQPGPHCPHLYPLAGGEHAEEGD